MEWGHEMSFRKNIFQQMSFTDSASNLTEREQKRLKNSWAEKFSNDIFPMINEDRFSVLYSDNKASRPNNPANVNIGMLILKSIFMQSDEESIDSLMFDVRYQHALHTTSFEEQPISKNSLSNFRCALYKYYEATGIDLIQEEVETHANTLSKIMGLDGKTQRMDSLMISSSCKKLSRLELIYSCVSRLIKMADKFNNVVYIMEVPEEFRRYLEEGYENEVIYRTRDTELSSKLETVIKDAIKLHAIYKDTMIAETEEYQLLSRMISEQTDGDSNLKEGKVIASDSLQNPTDPDATFRTKGNKKNVGYVGNVVETFNDDHSIITNYDLQQNIYSDAKFAQDIIDKLGKQEDEVNMITDGAYYSEQIAEVAAENNIKLIPTNMVGRHTIEENAGKENFVINEDAHTVVSCPMGNTPVKSSYVNGVYKAHFEKAVCEKCPNYSSCPLIKQKKLNLFMVTEKAYHMSKVKAQMNTDEYKELVKKRSGVEGIPSVLRRRYNIDNLPVRNIIRTKIWFGLKIYAINFKRYIIKDKVPKVKENKAAISTVNTIVEKYFVVNVQLFLNLFKPLRYNCI